MSEVDIFVSFSPFSPRSSKERSLFPKIDIAKEREERDNFTGTSGDYSSDSTPVTSVTAVVPDKNYSPPTARGGVNQNTTPKHSHVTTKPSNMTSTNVTSNSSTFEARDMVQENDNR